jgi:hypothetical protein
MGTGGKIILKWRARYTLLFNKNWRITVTRETFSAVESITLLYTYLILITECLDQTQLAHECYFTYTIARGECELVGWLSKLMRKRGELHTHAPM